MNRVRQRVLFFEPLGYWNVGWPVISPRKPSLVPLIAYYISRRTRGYAFLLARQLLFAPAQGTQRFMMASRAFGMRLPNLSTNELLHFFHESLFRLLS
jgi:hypothetical protein